MSRARTITPRERLVHHVQELERLEELKSRAAEIFNDALQAAKAAGFDGATIKAVLKLRKMTPAQTGTGDDVDRRNDRHSER